LRRRFDTDADTDTGRSHAAAVGVQAAVQHAAVNRRLAERLGRSATSGRSFRSGDEDPIGSCQDIARNRPFEW
jgi:hypothetical protein